MSKIKKTLALLLAVVMTIGMMTMPTLAAGTGDATKPVWPNEGAIHLDKKADPTDNDGEYEVVLKIEGKNFKTTSDVVLVIDCSGSMEGKKLTNTCEAAKAFGEKLLTAGSSTRIAIVTYADNATKYNNGHFYTSDELDAFKDAIDRATDADGGTNQQAGIHAAREILNSAASTGKIKNIVILSDGEPTYSYKLTGTAKWNNKCYFVLDHVWGDLLSGGAIVESTIAITGCDYNSRVGDGTSYDNYGTFAITSSCQHGETRTDNRYIEHSVAPIWEADQAKAEGTKIFSVALQAGTNGEATLKACASDPATGYFAISNNETNVSGKLTEAFTAIAGSIAIAAKDGIVTDPMSKFVSMVIKGSTPVVTNDKSEYDKRNADIYISQGKVVWNGSTETITWETGDINEGTPAVMKYRVVIDDPTVKPGDVIPTNNETTFNYKNYDDKDTNKNFDVPNVTPEAGLIKIHYYAVDADGNPINADGRIVERPDLAAEINASEDYIDPSTGKITLDYNKVYNVDCGGDISGYRYFGYTLDKYTVRPTNTESVAPVEITPTHANREVWFAYVPQFSVAHVQTGVVVETTTHDVAQNFDLTSVVSKDHLYGGAFDKETCGANDVQTFADGENATSFTPKAGETYYIWEVPDKYLMPKSITLRETNNDGNIDAMGFYMIAAIDRELYDRAGFDVTCNDVIKESKDIEDRWDVDHTSLSLKNSKIYDSVNIHLKNNVGTDTYTVGEKTVFGVETGYLFCYEVVKDDNWDTVNAKIVFTPYWVTLDGVKVNGVTRTCVYHGPMSMPANKYFVAKLGDTETRAASEYVGVATPLKTLRVFAALNAKPYEEETPVDKNTFTVTVHEYDDSTYTVSVEKGGSHELEYAGSLFAGWYTDESFTEPADLTSITSDMDVYAKYVSEDYLNVKYFEQGWFKVYGMTLLSAIDDGDYEDAGFIVNGEKYSYDNLIDSYGICSARILFGSNISRSSKLMTYDLSLRGMANGTEIEVTPYWVTSDGSTVEGTTRTFTYYSRGIQG